MVLEKEGLHFILTFLGKPSKPGFWRHLKKNKVEILVLRAQKEFLMQDDDKKRERQMNVASDAMKVAKFLWYCREQQNEIFRREKTSLPWRFCFLPRLFLTAIGDDYLIFRTAT